MTIVVLGMHGSGTSLVASMLLGMGVYMCRDKGGRVKDYDTYEDKDFLRLNSALLRAAGGNWRKPPDRKHIAANWAPFQERALKLIAAREALGRTWGFKDPRNCLTVSLYHPHLKEPRYVLVTRNLEEIARSMMLRSPGKIQDPQRWVGLATEYISRARDFLEGVSSPRLVLKYGNLVSMKQASAEAILLAKFAQVNRPGRRSRDALERVRFRT